MLAGKLGLHHVRLARHEHRVRGAPQQDLEMRA